MSNIQFKDFGGEEGSNYDSNNSNEKEFEVETTNTHNSNLRYAVNSLEFVQPERNESFTITTPENFASQNSVMAVISLPEYSNNDLHIELDFPPKIDPKDKAQSLLKKRRSSKKMLNEFFLYRNELVRALKNQGFHLKQTVVSKLASASWSKQPSNVKDEYRRLAREIENAFIAERQKESLRTSESSESSSENSTPSPVLANPNLTNFQLLDVSSQQGYLEQYQFNYIPYHNYQIYNPEPMIVPSQNSQDLFMKHPGRVRALVRQSFNPY